MPNLVQTGALRRLPLTLLMLSAAPAALAQTYPAGAVVEHVAQPNDPAELLAGALRTLATSPNDVEALVTAGENALALGDPNAAVGFFGRAGGLAPRNGKVKAGLGSALVQLERPADALRLFDEARRLGVPDADLAEDRGLAYDLTGDQRRAQADYQTVLAAHPDDDVARRRLALSQGISGNRAAAIATLDPLIRKRDIAGWRAQTFVLAMTGDPQGANAITKVMLPSQADMLQPFLVRLSHLSMADKARAVHFGEMPEAGRGYSPGQLANLGPAPTYQPLPSQQQPRAAVRSDLAPATTPRPPAAAPVRIAAAPRPVTPAPAQVPATPRSDLSGPVVQPRPATPAAVPLAATPRSTPATPPRPAPQVQIADATQPDALPLPTAASSGHYDLPHAAAARAPASPVRAVSRPVAPRPAPVGDLAPTPVRAAPAPAVAPTQEPARTVGTPVVHRTAHTRTPPARHEAEPSSATGETTAGSATYARHASSRSEVVEDATPDTASRSRHGKAAAGTATDTSAADTAKAKRSTRSRKGASGDEPADDTGAGTAHGARSRKAAVEGTADDDAGTRHGKTARHGKADDSADDTAHSSTPKHGRAAAKPDDETADGSGAKKGRHGKTGTSEKAEPSRVYVQVAGGANRDDLDKAWSRVKKSAPTLAKGHTPLTTPLRHTNRLLVGPFKNEDAAQAYVNKMAGKGVSAFVFKSDKGQKVDKVDTGQ